MKHLVLLASLLVLFACSSDQSPPEVAPWLLAGPDESSTSPPNILLIIGDDMGVETLASYGLSQNPPKTAHHFFGPSGSSALASQEIERFRFGHQIFLSHRKTG